MSTKRMVLFCGGNEFFKTFESHDEFLQFCAGLDNAINQNKDFVFYDVDGYDIWLGPDAVRGVVLKISPAEDME